jgi:hypothetical protein
LQSPPGQHDTQPTYISILENQTANLSTKQATAEFFYVCV